MARRRKASPPRNPRTVLLLGLAAALLFGLGQLALYVRSDPGAMFLARIFGIGASTRAPEILGERIRDGLAALRVPADSVRETRGDSGVPSHRLWIGLGPGASLIQANLAISRRVEEAGGAVLSGHERAEDGGRRRLTLVLGLHRRPMYEVVITTDPVTEANAEREPARMAVVLYEFAGDLDHAAAQFQMSVPFAAAIVPGGRLSSSLFDAARDAHREIVVMLPLEPINYPNVNPGPGTILVTMNDARVTSLVRRHLDQAGAVTAVGNFMGSLATQDLAVMTSIFRELKRRDLPFIQVRGVPGAVCRDLAANLGLVYDEPGVVFDPHHFGDDARRRRREWDNVLDLARARGRLMVWIPASESTLEWLPGAVSPETLQGVHLVPLSAVLARGGR